MSKLIQKKHEKSYKKGEIIYHEGDFPEYLYFVKSGLVGLSYISELGKETFFRISGKNDILGHASFFINEAYSGTSIALNQVTLIVISKDECIRISQEGPKFLLEVIYKLSSELGVAELRVVGLSEKSAPKRVAESLIFLKLKYSGQVWTRKEIANFSDTTSETVTRVMKTLVSLDLIQKVGRNYIITDLEQLYLFEE